MSRAGLLRTFGASASLTVIVVSAVLAFLGIGAALITLILVTVEVVFSFDNAILNAKVLGTLSAFWQRIFLSVGMIIAVLGMRVVFPIVVVAVTAHLGAQQVLDLALHHPEQYTAKLSDAHTAIAAFGGAFLLMLALNFFLDDRRRVLWLVRVEHFMQNLSQSWLPAVVTVLAVGSVAILPGNHETGRTLFAGLMGVATYLAVQLVMKLAGMMQQTPGSGAGTRTGFAAFVTFLYLEVLDASFSFDGVLGAFAITSKVILIAVGLGVGAFWVRSLSVFMVRRGTLQSYRYIEHGAHYTILILASLLLTSVVLDVPDAIAGLAGVGCIVSSVIASRQALAQKR